MEEVGHSRGDAAVASGEESNGVAGLDVANAVVGIHSGGRKVGRRFGDDIGIDGARGDAAAIYVGGCDGDDICAAGQSVTKPDSVTGVEGGVEQRAVP